MSRTNIVIGQQTFAWDASSRLLTDSEGNICSADVRQISPGEFSVLVNGESFHLFLNVSSEGTTVTLHNTVTAVETETFRDRLSKRLLSETAVVSQTVTVRAPMPGLITKLLISEGVSVAAGEGILIVEAMKMENEIKAPRSGTIKKIHIKEKQTVEKNDNLFTIE